MRIAAILLLVAVLIGASPPPATIESVAKVREAARHGDAIWPGYSSAPFGFLLVSDRGERPLAQFVIYILASSVIFAWLYNSTRAALPIVLPCS